MRKFISYLALLVIAFALPGKALAWDFNGGKDPSQIQLHFDNQGKEKPFMTFNSSASEYKWSTTWKATSDGYANYWVQVWNEKKDNNITYGNNNGTATVGVAVTCNPESTQYNYQGGLIKDHEYRIEIKDGGNDKFIIRFVDVTPVTPPTPAGTPDHLYIYWNGFGSKDELIKDGDTFKLTKDIANGTWFVLSTNSNATDWTSFDNGRYSPDGEVSIPCENSSFTQKGGLGQQWKASKNATYEIVVDWKAMTLTAKEKTTPTDPLNYNKNTNPKEIKLNLDNGRWAVHNMEWSTKYYWSYEFTAAGSQINFTVRPDGKEYYANVTHSVGETWSAAQNNPASSGNFHVTGLTKDKKYRFELKGSASNAAQFIFRVVPVVDTPVTDAPANLYIYTDLGDWKTRIGASASNNGTYTFNVTLNANQYIVLSKKDNAQGNDNGWNNMNGDLFTTSDGQDHALQANTSYGFVHANNGAWYAPAQGTYVISVNWATQQLTVVSFTSADAAIYLPLTKKDFEGGKKHYFIVGEREGEWLLLPEWELKKVGNNYVLDNRFMYSGFFAIGVVDNFDDYSKHYYDYYSKRYWFNESNLSSGTGLTKGRMSQASGTRKEGHDNYDGNALFRVNFNGKGKDDTGYYQGAGRFISRITVTVDGNGIPTSLAMTDGNAKSVENRLFALIGSNIYNKDFCNTSGYGAKTWMKRKGHSDDNGWQEGWIQYDPYTNKPYVDGNRNYLYHTSFTPDYLLTHPAFFNQTLPDGSELPYSSEEVIFVESSQLSDLDKDPYKEFYNAFTSGNISSSQSKKIDNKPGFNYNFTTSVDGDATSGNWKCYVVRDMWIAGEIKFWTGWGGNDASTNGGNEKVAVWHGPNGGPSKNDGLSDWEGHDPYRTVVSSDVTTGASAKLYRNVRNVQQNYMVSKDNKPVYFNRVVLWYDESKGVGESFIQFIRETASPAIRAQKIQNTTFGYADKYNYIKYNWYMSTDGTSNDNIQVDSYRIERFVYEGTEMVPDGFPEGATFKKIRKADGSYYTVADLAEGNTLDFTTFIDNGGDESGFEPGVYRYVVTVNLVDGSNKVVRDARSNRVPIYGTDLVTPEAVAMQIVELRHAYTDDYGKYAGKTQEAGDALTTTYESGVDYFSDVITDADRNNENRTFYLTYADSERSNFFIFETEDVKETINGKEVTTTVPKYMKKVDAKKALKFFKEEPQRYLWTSNYYLRCLNANEYESTMQRYVDNGLMKAIPTPVVTVNEIVDYTVTGGAAPVTEREIKPRGTAQSYTLDVVDNPNSQAYYAMIVKRHGNLADGKLNVSLNYKYETNDDQVMESSTTARTEFDPVIPRPYNPLYRYVMVKQLKYKDKVDAEGNVVKDKDGEPVQELVAPFGDYKWGKIKMATGHYNANGETEEKEVYVLLDSDKADGYDYDGLTPCSMNLQLDFSRPNVDADIYNFYNIHYNFTIENNSATVPLNVTAVLHDTEQTLPTSTTGKVRNRYRIEIQGTHPENAVYPIITFGDTEYEPNGHDGDSEYAGTDIDKYTYVAQTATYGELYKIEAMATVEVKRPDEKSLTEIRLGVRKNGNTYDWMYKGHSHLNDSPEELTTTAPYADQSILRFSPSYYLFELSNGINSATYPVLVPHDTKHINAVGRDLDSASGMWINDPDPLIGTYIAKGFTDSKVPTLYATAKYIFRRDVDGESTDNSKVAFNDLEVISYTNNVPAVPAPAKRADDRRKIGPTLDQYGNNGVLPDYAEPEAFAAKLAADGGVYDLSQPNPDTGYQGYIATTGASFNDTPSGQTVTGVEEVVLEGVDGEVIYYNVQGIRLGAEPSTPGVYFRVEGNQVIKFVVQ